jgi:hypothetical protein
LAIREELLGFVREGLQRGVPRPQIAAVLRRAGWPAEEVEKALRAFAEVEFPIPVPRPRPYLSAREAFFHLLQFAALYVSAWNVGHLWFLFIDRALPDPAVSRLGDYADDRIRWSVSALVIAFPIFLLASRSLARAAARDVERRSSKVRKWLTYMTLFVAATVLAGDLVSVLYNFLGGELTARFLPKAAAVAAIAGSVFGYFLWDLRDEESAAPEAASAAASRRPEGA